MDHFTFQVSVNKYCIITVSKLDTIQEPRLETVKEQSFKITTSSGKWKLDKKAVLASEDHRWVQVRMFWDTASAVGLNRTTEVKIKTFFSTQHVSNYLEQGMKLTYRWIFDFRTDITPIFKGVHNLFTSSRNLWGHNTSVRDKGVGICGGGGGGEGGWIEDLSKENKNKNWRCFGKWLKTLGFTNRPSFARYPSSQMSQCVWLYF